MSTRLEAPAKEPSSCEETALEATHDLLRRQTVPTALFTSQNLITIGAIRALRALELENRVALVGFDDLPLSDMLRPAVTVVAQDPGAIGTVACELLFSRMDGDDSPPQLRTIETRLLVRGSGEIPPQD